MKDLTGPQAEVLIAVIKERLRRILLAQDELYTAVATRTQPPDQDDSDWCEMVTHEIADQHGIPHLALHCDVACECSSKHALHQTERQIRAWVRGKMSPQEVEADLIGYAMEIDEYDYGYVFLDKPMGFYSPHVVNIPEIDAEMIAIGSRHYKYTPPEQANLGIALMQSAAARAVSTKKFFQMIAAVADVNRAAMKRELVA